MSETFALNTNVHGQVTLPKAFRDKIGLKVHEPIVARMSRNKLIIEKEPSFSEQMEAFRETLSPKTKARIAELREEYERTGHVKTVTELKNEWAASEEGQAYLREK